MLRIRSSEGLQRKVADPSLNSTLRLTLPPPWLIITQWLFVL